MKELREKIEYLLQNSDGDKAIIESIRNETSAEPFGTESRMLAYLLSIGKISFEDYLAMSNEYNERVQKNSPFLYLFEMAPRTFGQMWGEQHIMQLFPQFTKATKQNLSRVYPSFDGEFDLWLDGIRIEVKACRANNTTKKGSLSSRAYSHEDAQRENFQYHFQQLKPSCCDVFVWIGVCKDILLYWVLTSVQLCQTGKLVSQHRREHTDSANKIFEGQVFMTEEELFPFSVEETDLLAKVKELI